MLLLASNHLGIINTTNIIIIVIKIAIKLLLHYHFIFIIIVLIIVVAVIVFFVLFSITYHDTLGKIYIQHKILMGGRIVSVS